MRKLILLLLFIPLLLQAQTPVVEEQFGLDYGAWNDPDGLRPFYNATAIDKNDVLILVTITDSHDTMTTPIRWESDVPYPWTPIDSLFSDNVSIQWFWRRAFGTETGTTQDTIWRTSTNAVSGYGVSNIYRISGAHTVGTPFNVADVKQGITLDGIHKSSEITTVVEDALVLCLAAVQDNPTTLYKIGTSSGQLYDDFLQLLYGAGDDFSWGLSSYEQATPGTVSQGVATTTGTNDYWGSLTLAMYPSSQTPPPITRFPYYSKTAVVDSVNYANAQRLVNDSIYVLYPDVVDKNDVGIIIWSIEEADTPDEVPSGWTEIGGEADGGRGYSVYYYWKRFTGTEDGDSVLIRTTSNDCDIQASLMIFKNCVTTGTPFESDSVRDIAASNNRPTAPLTTTGTNRLGAVFTTIKSSSHWQPNYGWVNTDTCWGGSQVFVYDATGAQTHNLHTLKLPASGTTGEFTAGYYTDAYSNLTLAFIPEDETAYPVEIEGHSDYEESATGTVSITYPTVSENDIAYVYLVTEGNFSFTTPTDYTLMSTRSASVYSDALYYKRLAGTESGDLSCSVASGTPALMSGEMIIVTGAIESGTPYEGLVRENYNYGAYYESKAITTTEDSTLIIGIVTADLNHWSVYPQTFTGEFSRKYLLSNDHRVQWMSKQAAEAASFPMRAGYSTSANQMGTLTFATKYEPAAAATGYPNLIGGMIPTEVGGMSLSATSKVGGM